MHRRFFLAALAWAGLAAAAPAGPQTRPIPGMIRVRIVTSEGSITVALDARRAPRTTANFLAYVDDGRLDDTRFYRASRHPKAPQYGFIQGGIGTDARRMLPPLALEPTNMTGIKHLDATISMAHGSNEDMANCNFSLLVGANPGLDARPGNRGYAAFGRVIAGMDVVKRILAKPSGGGTGPMKGQMILNPVTIVRVERLDGTARPSGRPKTWLWGKKS